MPHSRTASGNHGLLPAENKGSNFTLPIPMPEHSATTLGAGTVIWRIWPAVLLHAVFATIIVVISRKTSLHLGIPNVLLTLLGVVIGFVISLRVSSGYDRYWWGRCAWSDIVKTSRTMSRLTWIHVPPRIVKPSGNDNLPIPREEVGQAMREKRIVLELIEAFAVAVKHHTRGEIGIYYEDLYHVVRPFHEHAQQVDPPAGSTPASGSTPPPGTIPPVSERRLPKRQFTIESYSQMPAAQLHKSPSLSKTLVSSQSTLGPSSSQNSSILLPEEQLVPHMTKSYGSTKNGLHHKASRTSLASSHSDGEREPLLPSSNPPVGDGNPVTHVHQSFLGYIGHAINPLNWWRSWRAHWREGFEGDDEAGGVGRRWGAVAAGTTEGDSTTATHGHKHHKRRRAARQTHQPGGKHRPRVAGDGDNLPLEIIRCMSEWLTILEARGTVGGNALGGLYGCVASYEEILSTLERILTTPLPYVYSVHISTVWLYLFFLPFQLVDAFDWYTIPGTAVAAFFYLGFIAAGDEIEQPFGYDDNDLDLDLFCRDIIKPDIHTLTMTPFPNAPIGSHRFDYEINEASTIVDVSLGKHLQK